MNFVFLMQKKKNLNQFQKKPSNRFLIKKYEKQLHFLLINFVDLHENF